jgi:hypothetical protein
MLSYRGLLHKPCALPRELTGRSRYRTWGIV